MKQKKSLAMLTAIMLLVSSLGLTAFAAGTGTSDPVSVYVTIADGDGKLALAQEKIEVTDIDNDNQLTINDALYCAHEAKYEGGAAAGYESTNDPGHGLKLEKLWGVANGGSYGYYVNHNSAWNLTDLVQEGDYIKAYIYQDSISYSDNYSYFDKKKVSVNQNEEVSLMLTMLTYDEEWNLQHVPATNAVITINGRKTDYKTDAEGKVTLKLTEAGTCVISAVSDSQILVPPVCVANVVAPATVYVTVSNAGKLELAQEPIVVTDLNKDGVLTIDEALYLAHEAKYEGGAATGYKSEATSYGLSLVKFWGDTSGAFGYYLNNTMLMSLSDTVKNGDYLNAFCYKDKSGYSDMFVYFNADTASCKTGESVSLVLTGVQFDENYAPYTVAVKNAVVTINGERTSVITDQNGKCSLTFDKAGTYVISAVSDSQVLVPTVCQVTVTAPLPVTAPKNGDTANTVMLGMLLAISLTTVVLYVYREKKYYEK